MNSSPNQGGKKGSVLGGSLLIAGSCIGAGMLALPLKTAMTGLIPFLFVFLLCWGFMTATGLLLLEVNLWYGAGSSISSMTYRTLGVVGRLVGWGMYCFLFYSLVIAYIAGSGSMLSGYFEQAFDCSLPVWMASLFFTLFFSLLIYLGTRVVDHANRWMMLILLLSYGILMILGVQHVQPELLQYQKWDYIPFLIPVLIVVFGFQNLIPSLTDYLQEDGPRLRRTIFWGGLGSLAMCLLWQFVILGMVPVEGPHGLLAAMKEGRMPIYALRENVGAGWVTDIGSIFSFFAILTSFVGVALSFVDFLSDGFQVRKTPKGKFFLCAVVMLPSYVFSLISPHVFLSALDVAGGLCAVIIFGVLPVLMVWRGRYRLGLQGTRFLPGGRLSLSVLLLFAVAIFLFQLSQEMGWIKLQL